jgi:hypothetical protein
MTLSLPNLLQAKLRASMIGAFVGGLSFLVVASRTPAAQPPPAASTATAATNFTATNGKTFTPHTARYAVRYRGIDAGTSEIRLEVLTGEGEARYRFTNRSTPQGLAALFLPGIITQRTTFNIGSDGLRPQEYSLDDGGKSTARDVRLTFDWGRNRVTGVAENQSVDLPLAPGTQDALTVGLQVRWLLQQGRAPQRLVMVEKATAKDYDYAFEGRERLQTALGPVDTLVWSSRRPGSNRVTRTWYAPAFGQVAVKAEQVAGSKPLMSFSILSWQPLP